MSRIMTGTARELRDHLMAAGATHEEAFLAVLHVRTNLLTGANYHNGNITIAARPPKP